MEYEEEGERDQTNSFCAPRNYIHTLQRIVIKIQAINILLTVLLFFLKRKFLIYSSIYYLLVCITIIEA